MKKVLIDTNVVIDVLTSRKPWHVDGERIFLMVANEQIDGMITASAITDIYYLLRIHTKDTAVAKKALEDLLSLFKILDVTGEDCINALALPMKDYEDAVVASIAARSGISCIISRNVKDYVYSPVKAVEPGEFSM